MKKTRATATKVYPLRAVCLLVACLALTAGELASTQVLAPQDQSVATARVGLTAGRSTVLTVDFDITRIALTNPAVADATVVEPREILIDGKAPGTVTMILWGADRRVQYDVVVDPPVSAIQQQLRNLFPGEDINVTVQDEATTLSGRVSSTAVMLKAAEIAQITSSKTKVINLLQVPGGGQSDQVLLQVRFAEVNRQALTDAGISLFTGPGGYKDWVARVTPNSAAPTFTTIPGGDVVLGDLLNIFAFNTKYNIGALIRALQSKGLLQSLAEPNLIAYNGQEASFLAGGEVPIPIVTGGTLAAVSVQYKEFGVRLNFRPTIAGDVIRLKVRPEVSSLDFANGVTLAGFRIPALITRRAETEIELRDGQSFAIAGLMNNIAQDARNQIPGLGSLPIIGLLFKNMSTRKERTELMVLVTPHLVRPLDPDEVPSLPTDPRLFLRPGGNGVGDALQGGGGTMDGPPTPAAPRKGSGG
jgi:pilus assembly protein CpaC